MPASDQPNFLNSVIEIESELDPYLLLTRLHSVEAAFGRTRSHLNAPRTLDLDLLGCGDYVIADRGGLTVPHLRLHNRAFVLVPLAEIAPDWRHPVLGRTAKELECALKPWDRLGVMRAKSDAIPQASSLPVALPDA